LPPALTVAGPVFVTERSALCVTVVAAPEELFAALVSKLEVVTDAVLVYADALPVSIDRVNWAEAPFASAAKVQATRPFAPANGTLQEAAGPVS